jgi:hypothetical protein
LIREALDGQSHRALVACGIVDADSDTHQAIRFLLQINEKDADEIISYNEFCDLMEAQQTGPVTNGNVKGHFKFTSVIGHQGPLQPTDANYKGSSWNVLFKWEDGSQTYKPLIEMAKDNLVTLAMYASENDLLAVPEWRRFNRLLRNRDKFNRTVSLTKQRKGDPIFKFGVLVPRNSREALKFDADAGNTRWADAMALELAQHCEYKTYKDLDKCTAKPGPGYQRINIHFVLDVKQSLKYKARLVAGGHMTAPPKDSVYSGVVSLRSIHLAILAGELNGLDTWVSDIAVAYLEAYTKEQVYFVAGPEFGELSGHTLLIDKALYGLGTSGARFHERLRIPFVQWILSLAKQTLISGCVTAKTIGSMFVCMSTILRASHEIPRPFLIPLFQTITTP